MSVEGTAPGRIDFLGGVADYSGSWVLEAPIPHETKVAISFADHWSFRSRQAEEYTLPAALWPEIATMTELAVVREALENAAVPIWVKYVFGCLLILVHDHKLSLPVRPLAFAIDSAVPLGMGVSSSAAIEVATLRALTDLFHLQWQRTELARVAQRAENEIVGAPCGLMDQLTSAYGCTRSLLPILCRPDELDNPIPLPDEIAIAGWPSGIKPNVKVSPYVRARTAAFMGKRILEIELGKEVLHLTEIRISELVRLLSKLPWQMRGREFVSKYGSHDDLFTAFTQPPEKAEDQTFRASSIEPSAVRLVEQGSQGSIEVRRHAMTKEPALSLAELERLDREYPVRAATQFPIEESFRVQLARSLLRGLAALPDHIRRDHLQLIGELMFQSHEGYSAMGLGSPETDEMVDTLREMGPHRGIYGARVSAGGSGGTVVVLLENAMLPHLEKLRRIFDSPHPLILV